MTFSNDLKQQFGSIDIYLFDQILKGRFDHCARILDVGCGSGRNLIFFLRQGFEVYGVDPDAGAIDQVRKIAADLAPQLPAANFQAARVEEIAFADGYFDAVLGSAVLHFAADEPHFLRMLKAMWRVLKEGGLFFVRLASSIGLEEHIQPVAGRRCRLPDGTIRFLVDETLLLDATKAFGGTLLEPIKTTRVQNLRCMTTWCVEKNPGFSEW